MKLIIKNFIGILLASLVLCGIALMLYAVSSYVSSIVTSNPSSVNTAQAKKITVVLDAGHGGMDGGAVGVSGVKEKELNLKIAQKLKGMLEEKGVTVILTREEDILLSDQASGSRKLQDLRERVRIANETENSIFVSIHMNRFPDSNVQGMTFYYSPNHHDSYRIAKLMQEALRKDLQKENKRPLKEASSSIYLLYHATVPAVLVECGFLSNPNEEALLCDDTYQNAVSALLSVALLSYINEKESS